MTMDTNTALVLAFAIAAVASVAIAWVERQRGG